MSEQVSAAGGVLNVPRLTLNKIVEVAGLSRRSIEAVRRCQPAGIQFAGAGAAGSHSVPGAASQ